MIISNIVTDQGYDDTSGRLLDFNYIKNYYKMIAIDLNTQQAFDDEPKAMQKISFIGNLSRAAGETIFFVIKEAK